MKNKKGFTLVEIIVCITLITIIGVSTFVGFKIYNNKNKTKSKIISEITSAADVYYEANEKLKEKLEKNYGYLVVNISDLKDNGIIDENKKVPKLTTDEKNEGKTYDKLVIDGSSNNELGLTDIIYPYEKNKNLFMMNLYEVYLEYFEKDLFKCNYNLEHIDYMKDDYEIDENDNFLCGIDKLENNIDNTNYNNKSNIIYNLNQGTNYIRYKINSNGNIITGVRNVFINSEYNPTFETKLDNGNTYNCGDWTNQNINIYYKDNDEQAIRNNLTFNWYKDNTLIDGENKDTFIATESALYNGKYELKGNISNYSKTGSNECIVKIDKDKPIINISVINNKINISITDNDSGVYGYYYSQEKKDNLSINDFTKGNKVSFNKPNRSLIYYIYAMDNAGNIKEKIYENIGDEKYPSITYEPIENSFTKFKVTVKDISGKNYKIDDIKVQFEFDSDKYNFYKENYSPGEKYDLEDKEKFKNNFTYNKEYDTNKKNYIDIKNNENNEYEYTCNNNECSFIIDMDKQIEVCQSHYYCYGYVKEKNLNNLSLNYYIKVRNNKGYYKELKLNSILNIYENEKTFDSKWHKSSIHTSKLIGTNENGDILFDVYYNGNKKGEKAYTTIYYYDTNNSEIYSLGKYFNNDWPYISYDWFNKESIGFTICNNYEETSYSRYWTTISYYKAYEKCSFDLETNELTNCESYDEQDSGICNFEDSVQKLYRSDKYDEKYENGGYLKTFVKRLTYWEKKLYTNPTKHNISDELDNYIFNSTENGKEWESILTYDADSKSGDYNKLFFLPEVSLSKKDVNTGTTS